jgi:tetratricopeptide (TPR) repeat protein
MQDDAATAITGMIEALVPGLSAGPAPDARRMDEALALARKAMECGHAASAIELLQALRLHFPDHAGIAQLLGFALRLEQRLVEAEAVFSGALSHAPAVPALLFGQAQTRFELGLPAAAHFAHLQTVMPGNAEVLRNRAAAMASEGDRAGAEALLLDALKARPDWLDGHKGLATLRWTGGDMVHFADSYGAACRAQPANGGLWTAWFSAVAQTRDWQASRSVLDQAERHLGQTPSILSARLFMAAEAGEAAEAETLLAAAAHIQGDTINLCRVRHALRQGRPEQAEALLEPLVRAPSAGLFWPYLSLTWRLLGDERHLWLDNPDSFIQHGDIGLTAAELAELADVLRALHTMEKPYAEQTVRGGTQTDRSVMLRHEPILQRTRAAWLEAIRDMIARLPAHQAGHPLLGGPRGHLLLGGSWSVRLQPQGHNVPHTHPMGWLSSSFYVAIPDEAHRGPAPAGHIAFGTPPVELGLDLPAYRTIAPRPGMIAMFPSTMWHAVVPFEQGERLMIALDIRPPHY